MPTLSSFLIYSTRSFWTRNWMATLWKYHSYLHQRTPIPCELLPKQISYTFVKLHISYVATIWFPSSISEPTLYCIKKWGSAVRSQHSLTHSVKPHTNSPQVTVASMWWNTLGSFKILFTQKWALMRTRLNKKYGACPRIVKFFVQKYFRTIWFIRKYFNTNIFYTKI